MCQEQIDEPEEGESALKALAVFYYRQGKLEQVEPLLHRVVTDLQPELDIYIRAPETQSGFFLGGSRVPQHTRPTLLGSRKARSGRTLSPACRRTSSAGLAFQRHLQGETFLWIF